MKLSQIINESNWYEEDHTVSEEQKKNFLEAVKNYNALGKIIYREGNLLEVAKTLLGISKIAERFTLQETDDWFDKITVKRNMKELTTLGEQFVKLANDAQKLQDRMTAMYEDVGHILNRYYSIDEFQEELERGQRQNNRFKNKYKLSDGGGEIQEEETENYNNVMSARNYSKIKRQQKRHDKKTRSVKFNRKINNKRIPTKLNLSLGETGFDSKRMEASVKKDKFLQIKLKQYGGDLKKLWRQYGYGD